MYFPTTNYKRTDYYRVMFLRSWKYFCLWKDCCELEKAEEKLFLLENLQKYFEFVFPHLYFKLAIGKKIRFVYVSKKIRPERPSSIDFSTWKGQGRESWSLLSSIGVLCQSVCTQMIYSEKQSLHLEKFQNGVLVPHGVFANAVMHQGSQLHVSCLPALTQA